MKTRTLFIEDERWGISPYFKALEGYNFECVLARTGDEALKKLKRQKFDLISMDVMFQPGDALGEVRPIKAGVRLLEMIRTGQIKNCDPDIKVLVFTAVSDSGVESRMKKLGVEVYLKKVIDFTRVIETFCELSKQNRSKDD